MASAVILAGGHSRRFGRDKASEPLLGQPLVAHVVARCAAVADDVVVVRRAGQELPPIEAPRIRLIDDVYPDTGPLGGLLSGLREVTGESAIAVACDMPLLSPALLALLLRVLPGHEAAVPLCDGRPQPLCAAYARACLDRLAGEIEAGRLRLVDFLDAIGTRYLEPEEWRAADPAGHSFLNLNTPHDLEVAAAVLLARDPSLPA
jgi:molybdopterin-guanine dinucleotide biosynthesis protein A